MCLSLEIELPLEVAKGRISARRLSREIGLRVAGYHTPEGRRRFHFARRKECSCSLLVEGFEADAPKWPLEPDAGEALARAVSLVSATVPRFTLRSVWLGSEAEPSHSTVTVAEVLRELRSNRLLAHAVREVTSAA